MKKSRECLKCEEIFLSEGDYNRICKPCNTMNSKKTRTEQHRINYQGHRYRKAESK